MRRQPQLLWRRAPRQKAGWRSLQPVPVAVPRGAGRARSSPQPPGKAQGSAPAPAVPGCTGQGALTASASMLGLPFFRISFANLFASDSILLYKCECSVLLVDHLFSVNVIPCLPFSFSPYVHFNVFFLLQFECVQNCCVWKILQF